MAESETRLGRGLGALMGEYMEEDRPVERPGGREIRVSDIRPNPFQPRSDFRAAALQELMDSIRENGLLQPLVVRPAEEGWEIVAGERRWRCLVKLGWETAPVVVRDLPDEQMLVLALVENLQRENLSPLEEAIGYRRLMESFDLTQKQVAERVGRDRSTVANALRLLGLPDAIRDLLAAGRLTQGHARAILGLEGEERQLALAREVVDRELSVRVTERHVRELRSGEDEEDSSGKATEAGPSEPDPVARRAEEILERALGTGVRIRLDGAEKGEIGITFHDSEEFERLVSRIGGEEIGNLFRA